MIEFETTHDGHALVIARGEAGIDVVVEATRSMIGIGVWSDGVVEHEQVGLGDFLRGLGLTAEDCADALTENPLPPPRETVQEVVARCLAEGWSWEGTDALSMLSPPAEDPRRSWTARWARAGLNQLVPHYAWKDGQ